MPSVVSAPGVPFVLTLASQMVRVFVLDLHSSEVTVGFEAQSPTGDGCAVVFDEIAFSRDRLHELRDGS